MTTVNGRYFGQHCSPTVWGNAARNILAGNLPDDVEHDCCRMTHRVCWHKAAAVLIEQGLRPASTDEAAEPARGLW